MKIELIKKLQSMLHAENRYVRQFKSASERISVENCPDMKVVLKDVRICNVHEGRTNLPSNEDEVAVVICSDEFEK